MDQSKKDPTKSNLMYLTIFLLLTISASRELAMNLNTPFTINIKLDLIEVSGWSASGNVYTFADLVFVSVYGLIKNGPRLLRPIYKSIIAILSNIAPYTKNLCKEGCEGLMYLLNVFAKKEFLLEKEDNCKTLGSLVEAINYLIAYHDETNHYLQIQLMKYQSVFDYLEQSINEIGEAKQQAQAAEQTKSSAIAGGRQEDEVQQLDADEGPQEGERPMDEPRQQFQTVSQQEKREEDRLTEEPKAEDQKQAQEDGEQKKGEGMVEKFEKPKMTLQTQAKIEMDDLEQKAREEYEKESEPVATSGDDMMAAFLARASEKSNEQKQVEQVTAPASEPNDAVEEQAETGAPSKSAEGAEIEKEKKDEASEEAPTSKDDGEQNKDAA